MASPREAWCWRSLATIFMRHSEQGGVGLVGGEGDNSLKIRGRRVSQNRIVQNVNPGIPSCVKDGNRLEILIDGENKRK